MKKGFEMVNKLKIELMKKEDIDGVYLVEKDAFEHHWSKKEFEKELKNNVARYLVAKIDNEIIGYLGVWFILDEGHITNVAVKKEYRNMKIGTQLVEKLILMANENKIMSLTLEVRESNMNAQKLYKSNGFMLSGIRKEYYSDNKENAIIMWKHMKEV